MSFTNYLAGKVLDQLFGAQAYTASGTLYVGLSTTTPAENGTNFTEPATASGYYRVPVSNNKSNWSAATNADPSVLDNRTTITFDQASGNWGNGNLTYFGIFDNQEGGNLLAAGALTVPKPITTNDTASFASGAIEITLT